MDQSRRDALKKLGIGTGVAWAAPAVTVLVVPTHASATSSSGGSDGSSAVMQATTYTGTVSGTNISFTVPAAAATSNNLTITYTGGGYSGWSTPPTKIDAALTEGGPPSSSTGPTTGGSWALLNSVSPSVALPYAIWVAPNGQITP